MPNTEFSGRRRSAEAAPEGKTAAGAEEEEAEAEAEGGGGEKEAHEKAKKKTKRAATKRPRRRAGSLHHQLRHLPHPAGGRARPAPPGRTSTELKPSEEAVEHQVINGGGAMPAFGKSNILTPKEIHEVSKYVSSVAGK